MESIDELLRGGWTPDPADRVEVVAVHRRGCPAADGRGCACTPRLMLRPVARRCDPLHDEPVERPGPAARATG